MSDLIHSFHKEGFPDIRVYRSHLEVQLMPDSYIKSIPFKEIASIAYVDPFDTAWGRISLLFTPKGLQRSRNQQQIKITLRNGEQLKYGVPSSFDPEFAAFVNDVRSRCGLE